MLFLVLSLQVMKSTFLSFFKLEKKTNFVNFFWLIEAEKKLEANIKRFSNKQKHTYHDIIEDDFQIKGGPT